MRVVVAGGPPGYPGSNLCSAGGPLREGSRLPRRRILLIPPHHHFEVAFGDVTKPPFPPTRLVRLRRLLSCCRLHRSQSPTAKIGESPFSSFVASDTMKVVVTGASGYLGSNLCRVLLREGHSVRALVRRSSDVTSLPTTTSSHNFELAFGDVTDLPSLLAAFSGCDVLFHTAAVVEPWLPNPSAFFSVNVEGLKNVLQAFRETGSLQKMVYTSSFFALGPTDGSLGVEGQMHHEKFFCTEYERSKVMADKIALHEAANGLPIVIVYPGVIYGPGRLTSGNIVAHMILERFSGRLPGYVGNGNERFSFSHVEDVIHGHIAAMERGKIGERYLLAGENASFTNVFDIAAMVTGTRRPLFRIPLWLVEIYGWINVFWARLTRTIPLISYPTVHVMRHQWAYSSEKAKAELNYTPRSLKDGLTDILIWLKSQGKIKY